jgi:hypothetical protein
MTRDVESFQPLESADFITIQPRRVRQPTCMVSGFSRKKFSEGPMLFKCANPPCVSLFRSMHQGKLFAVESETGESHAPSQTNGGRKHRLPRVEHYWLCDQCFPVVTLTFSKGLGLIVVPLLPPHPRIVETRKSVNSLRLGELLPAESARQRETA